MGQPCELQVPAGASQTRGEDIDALHRAWPKGQKNAAIVAAALAPLRCERAGFVGTAAGQDGRRVAWYGALLASCEAVAARAGGAGALCDQARVVRGERAECAAWNAPPPSAGRGHLGHLPSRPSAPTASPGSAGSSRAPQGKIHRVDPDFGST